MVTIIREQRIKERLVKSESPDLPFQEIRRHWLREHVRHWISFQPQIVLFQSGRRTVLSEHPYHLAECSSQTGHCRKFSRTRESWGDSSRDPNDTFTGRNLARAVVPSVSRSRATVESHRGRPRGRAAAVTLSLLPETDVVRRARRGRVTSRGTASVGRRCAREMSWGNARSHGRRTGRDKRSDDVPRWNAERTRRPPSRKGNRQRGGTSRDSGKHLTARLAGLIHLPGAGLPRYPCGKRNFAPVGFVGWIAE